jgi:hypothetical protein
MAIFLGRETLASISLWHILVGFFFSNGMPHFLFGAAGKRFRWPLGANGPASGNLFWGLINFALGTGLVLWLNPSPGNGYESWLGFLIGFWIGVAMFGFGMGHFLSDEDKADKQTDA